MKNNKGFTLIELLTAIVILGIVLGMAWPAIRQMQESNAYQKYEYYGEAMISAAKIFVDSYEEDYFCYDSDVEKGKCAGYSSAKGECVTIPINELFEKGLLKDINIDEMSCDTDSSFVRVIKKNKKYKYKYYLGCGKKDDNVIADILLPNQEVESNDRVLVCNES